MKKLHILILAVGLSFTAAACRSNGPHVVIQTSENSRFKRVEYSGKIVFSEDKSSISYMSEGAYFKFKTNDDKLIAERNDRGQIVYDFNGIKMNLLNDDAKRLMEAAVVEIEKTKGRKG